MDYEANRRIEIEEIQVHTTDYHPPHEFYKSYVMTATKIINSSNIQDNDI